MATMRNVTVHPTKSRHTQSAFKQWAVSFTIFKTGWLKDLYSKLQDPKDEGSTFFLNVVNLLQSYTASHTRRTEHSRNNLFTKIKQQNSSNHNSTSKNNETNKSFELENYVIIQAYFMSSLRNTLLCKVKFINLYTIYFFRFFKAFIHVVFY